MSTQPPRPLSAEEEAKLRRDVAGIGLCRVDSDGLCETHSELSFGGECEDSPLATVRLLATLDVAREPAGAGLREAVKALARSMDDWLASWPAPSPDDRTAIRAWHTSLRAALAASPAEPRLGHGDHPNDGYLYEGCPGCHPARDSAGLREAAQALVDAAEAVRDAINGVGHPGTPHDRDIHMDPCTSDPGIHVYSPSSDCAACGGAEYGTEDTYSQALGDLRAALGMERRPWEGPGLRAALEAASPAEPGLDELREAGGGYEVRTWVRHEPSGVVVLKGHPQLGGRYCLTDGSDWPCASVRVALAEPKP